MTEDEKSAINSNKGTKCEIVEIFGTVGERMTKDGTQTLDLCLIKWFNGPEKMDLRWWTGTQVGKGCTFGTKEAIALRDLLNSLELGEEK